MKAQIDRVEHLNRVEHLTGITVRGAYVDLGYRAMTPRPAAPGPPPDTTSASAFASPGSGFFGP